MKEAIILGAGPAGLVAAEAMSASGVRVHGIYTAPTVESGNVHNLEPKKSELHGAQFLHGPIWGSRVQHGDPFFVTYRVSGEPDQYTMKVYGPGATQGSSADRYKDGYQMLGWDIRSAYDQLWEHWYGYMRAVHINPHFLEQLIKSIEAGGDRVMVISTVPRTMLCVNREEHAFLSQEVYALGDGPGYPVNLQDNTIHMNGEPNPGWYRASKIQGHTTVEWPGKYRPPVEGVVPIKKPLRHTCTCWQGDPVKFLGRFGTWNKSILVHEVYDSARDIGRKLAAK